MFRWLSKLVWHDDFIGDIISRSGYRDRIEQHDARDKQRREEETQARLEQQRYERELRDPYWARSAPKENRSATIEG